jgi:hypothetical protein
MWRSTDDFKVFGDGSDKIILVTDGIGYLVHNPFLTEVYTQVTVLDCQALGDDYKRYISGPVSCDLTFKCGHIEVVTDEDLKKLITPLMDKSVLELMQIVNQKLKGRN